MHQIVIEALVWKLWFIILLKMILKETLPKKVLHNLFLKSF